MASIFGRVEPKRSKEVGGPRDLARVPTAALALVEMRRERHDVVAPCDAVEDEGVRPAGADAVPRSDGLPHGRHTGRGLTVVGSAAVSRRRNHPNHDVCGSTPPFAAARASRTSIALRARVSRSSSRILAIS